MLTSNRVFESLLLALLVAVATAAQGCGSCGSNPDDGLPDGDADAGDTDAGDAIDTGDGSEVTDAADIPDIEDATDTTEVPAPLAPELYVNRAYLPVTRELVGVPRRDGSSQAVFLSWRMLMGDDDLVEYEVRRSDTRDLDCGADVYAPVGTTEYNSFMDTTVTEGERYFYCIQPVSGGAPASPASNVVRVDAAGGADPYDEDVGEVISLPLGGASCGSPAFPLGDALVPGDLDGNGSLDLVVRFCDQDGGLPCRGSDFYVQAFIRNAVGRWRPAWCYATESLSVPAIVWDLDGDRAAEVVTVYNGSTRLVVLDGATGEVIVDESNFASDDGGAAHRWYSHFNVAYLDGLRPLVIAQNSHFSGGPTIRISAYALSTDGASATYEKEHEFTWNQALGVHGLPVADLNCDGEDEVIPCGKSLHLTSGGLEALWTIPNSPPSATLHHDDTCFVADLVPGRLGLETFYGIERNGYTLAEGVGVVTMDNVRLWVRANGSFPASGIPGETSSDFRGWEKGECFESVDGNGAMECFIAEICEDACIDDNELTDRYWTGSFIFNARTGVEVDSWAPRRNSRADRSGIDWARGDGRVTPTGAGLGTALGDQAMDIIGDSRMELIRCGGDVVEIHVNADVNEARYISPLYDPNYFKTRANHGNGSYAYTGVMHINRSFVFACEVGPIRTIRLPPGEEYSFVCGVASTLGFEGPVTFSAEDVPAELECTFGPGRLDELTVDLPAGGTSLFELIVAADATATGGPHGFKILGATDSAALRLERRLWFEIEIE